MLVFNTPLNVSVETLTEDTEGLRDATNLVQETVDTCVEVDGDKTSTKLVTDYQEEHQSTGADH